MFRIRMAIQILLVKWYTQKVQKSCGSCDGFLRVNRYSKVTGDTYLGEHVNFNGMTIKGGGKVYIGRYFHSGVDCLIITQNHDYDEGRAIPYDSEKYVKKDVIIDDFVWIGDRVIILGGSHIGEGAIIQAGSVVCSSIPPYGIAGGHPATVFKYRDIEHFNSLKEQRHFC